jgi:hypothetical protein
MSGNSKKCYIGEDSDDEKPLAQVREKLLRRRRHEGDYDDDDEPLIVVKKRLLKRKYKGRRWSCECPCVMAYKAANPKSN